VTQQPAQVGPAVKPRGHAQPQSGINAAVRELGITRQEGQRAAKIDAISPEAKKAAKAAGLDDNQSALMQVAREVKERQVEKVEELRRQREGAR